MAQMRQPTAQENYDYLQQQEDAAGAEIRRRQLNLITSGIPDPWLRQAEQAKSNAATSRRKAWDTLQAEKKAAWAKDPNNPAVKAEANWQEGMKRLEQKGPYTPEMTQGIINRQADQSAAAEAVNADEIRNMAAARGLDPTQALRQGQQQRQAQNLAFQGDITAKAAEQNFAAETPGRMAAAQAYLNRMLTGNRTAAVTGGNMAFSQPRPVQQSSGYNPGAIHQAAAGQRIQTQPANLNRTAPAPQPKPQPQPRPAPAPKVGPQPGYVTNPPTKSGDYGGYIMRTQADQNSLLKSLNAPGNYQYQPGVPTKIPLAFDPKNNPFQ